MVAAKSLLKKSKPRKPYKKRTKKSKVKPKKLDKDLKQECQTCNIEFGTKEELAEHKKALHSESWICEVCGKVFVSRASSYSHMRCHQPPQYACYACDYRAGFKYDLVKHLRIHTADKCFQCEYCTRSFHTSSNLRDHIKRNHMPKQRQFQCHLCEKRFYDKTKLNRHVDAHNNILRYECELCKAQFARRNYWKDHLQKVHDVTVPPLRPGRRRNTVFEDKKFAEVIHSSAGSEKNVKDGNEDSEKNES